MLKLSWAEAHHEAGKWEHIMSDSVEKALNDLLGSPTTCPHGNPIPGSGYEAPDSGPLSAITVGSPFTVRRIAEELEFEPGLLEFLEESAIQPGNQGTVTAASPDGTLTVEIDGRHIGLGSFASEHLGHLVTRPHRAFRLAALAVTGVLVASCADTVVDVESDDGEVNVEGSFETVPTTTLPIVGTTAELLTEMSTQMSQLSAQIGDAGDEKATLQRIDAIWLIARPDVESTRPELVNGIDTTVDMARTAVVRIRPADGDKAFQLFSNLVDRYTGDG